MTISDIVAYVIGIPLIAGVGMILGSLGYFVMKRLVDKREPNEAETREAMMASFTTSLVIIILATIMYNGWW